MKLDRNNNKGRGKYALVRLRGLSEAVLAAPALDELVRGHVVEFGAVGDENEFFVIKLKDKYADAALLAYAADAALDGEIEYAEEVRQLAARAGRNSPFSKKPD